MSLTKKEALKKATDMSDAVNMAIQNKRLDVRNGLNAVTELNQSFNLWVKTQPSAWQGELRSRYRDMGDWW